MIALFRRLSRDRRGVTIVEFALVAPVMLILLMGLGDMLYQGYVQSVLTGAVQKAARDATIQGNAQNTAALDAKVTSMVQYIAPAATFASSRKSYAYFGAAAPEPFIDTNGNGVRDPGECYTDINGNKAWDADPGATGQGGANDATMYTMTVTYPRLFPVASLIGWPSTLTISAMTFLKNQPYATQVQPTQATICI
ncbi:TadE/TadG family type IV pilus assembly protein [Sphingomonas sp. TX0543]|uniref:TadE/TadG family type IV pilus assembly protein n=1 Tax=unclassified Sphingomonas TaxID=196159 RepID=UPI0010F6A3A8|nr:TadE family protein [Sphingomonas sp. 3P27F8]